MPRQMRNDWRRLKIGVMNFELSYIRAPHVVPKLKTVHPKHFEDDTSFVSRLTGERCLYVQVMACIEAII